MSVSIPMGPLAIETAALMLTHAPPYARNVLLLGCEREWLPAIAARASFPPHSRVTTAMECDQKLPATQDCILFIPPARDESTLGLLCGQAVRVLPPFACAFMAISNTPQSQPETVVSDLLREHGLEIYNSWPANINGPGLLIQAVRDDYDPVAHARGLLADNDAPRAYHVLSEIPSSLRSDPATNAFVLAMMSLCLAVMNNESDKVFPLLERFHIANKLFLESTHQSPTPLPQAFISQAEFWRRLGEPMIAMGLLDTIGMLAPDDPAIRELRTALSATPIRRTLSTPLEPPEWKDGMRPRVLVLPSSTPNIGLDILIDGLHRVLGPDHVVDFPAKDSLHGRSSGLAARYPCHFNLPEHTYTLDAIADLLSEGAFDVVLCDYFGAPTADDMHRFYKLSREETRLLMECAAASSTPLFIVDQSDFLEDFRPKVIDWLGRDHVNGYFKREMLACMDYGPGVYPLPYSYSPAYMVEPAPFARDIPVFWAGNATCGSRKACLGYLSENGLLDIGKKYTQEEYSRALRASRVALDFPGIGYDTVRYWEAPAHGAMLLAERRPTVIPFDFEDGVSAVFFNGLPELVAKLEHYVSHPDEAAIIAKTGHDHLLRHHTNEARARHLLGWIASALGWS